MTSRPPHFSQHDIDNLLMGAVPRQGRLAALIPLVAGLRRFASLVPSDEKTSSFASRAATLAHQTPVRPVATGGIHEEPGPRQPRHRPRLALATATLVAMLSVSAGIAYAANAASPGDTLYSLDLAMEDMGIANGGLHERLAEANKLVLRGHLHEGLATAANAIARHAPNDALAKHAVQALLDAAQAVSAPADAQSFTVRARVARRLQLLATTDLGDNEFGQAVSALAHDLSSNDATAGSSSTTTVSTTRPSPGSDFGKPGGGNNPRGRGRDRSGGSDGSAPR